MARPSALRPLAGATLAAVALGVVACGSRRSSGAPSASASASAAEVVAGDSPPPAASIGREVAWLGIHKSANDVAKVINKAGNRPYTGKTGNVHGTITITGDPPPEVPFHADRECLTAKGYYDRLFRKSENGAVADAVVTVTGYEAFLPVDKPVKQVLINDCSFGSRSFVMTYGQRMEVSNRDTKPSFIPYLDGAPFPAARVATPQGNAVELYPEEPGLYLLRDMLKHPYMLAHVFVLPYQTADVTGQDGHFEIKGVPVGKVKVSAFLPMLDKKAVEKDLEVKEGENEIELALSYDKATDKPVVIPDAVWQQKH